VSTATTGLRRAGAGGLAAAVVAGMVVASAGIASAAATPVAGTYQLTATSAATTIYPGLANQAAGDVEYWTASSWTTGATLKFTIAGNDCSTATTLKNAVSFSAAPSVTLAGPFVQATGAAGTAAKPTFSTALSSTGGAGGQCDLAGVKDVLTITFNQPANPVNGDVFSVTLGGIKYTTGSTALGPVSLGAAITGALTAPAPAAVVNATVANTKFVAASIAPAVPSQTGVALGNMTASDVGSAHITSPITYTLSGGLFTATSTPAVAGPAGTTWTVTGMGTAVLTATLATGALPTTANSYVLSGATITAPAAAGAVTVTARYGATVIGAPATVASVVAQTRIGGTDRYATAANLFTAGGFGGTAVLASGANFPDALSANFLASKLGTGTLLTAPTALPSVTFNTIITRGVSTVYIVGGTGAVSAGVANQIAATHVANQPNAAFINVVRIAGADRYATNLAVNEYQFATHTTAIIATGANFADALAVGPAVVNAQYPLILTSGTALSATAAQQLTDMGVTNVVIVGGTGAVSSAVETAIKGMGITITARLAGADRTQTAAAIATWETTSVANGGLGMAQATVHIANGADFPDALAAGPVAGSGAGAVILLSLSPTTLGAGAPTYLAGLTGTVTTLNALGLTGAVSPAVMNAAAVALAG
jgi:putative cell wall-binding protein